MKKQHLSEEIKPLQDILYQWIDRYLKPPHYADLLPRLLLREVLTTWFTGGGGSSYYFLFRKNAYVTNVSFGELVALIKVHTHRRAQPELRPYLQFQTSRRFKDNLTLLWDSFGSDVDSQQIKTKAAFILTNYPQLFSNTILVDPFFGSAVIHLPNPLMLDLRLICGEAGYIHSCGEAIYVRKIVRSEQQTLIDKVQDYIQQRGYSSQTTFFSTYSHEQFTPYENPNNEPEYRHGLHDVKIDLAKFHLDNTPLFDVLSELKSRLKDSIYIPPGIDPYKAERAAFIDNYGERANRQVTLWLLMDRSLPEESSDFQYPGRDRYFICYAQQYANRNPFISFNERKPGWIAPTTLPHTLATAMINLARPYLPHRRCQRASTEPEQEPIRILDPFSGTGTTFLETLKLGLHMHFSASDNHPMSVLLLKDNLHFFSLSKEELHNRHHELQSLLTDVKDREDTSTFRYPSGSTTRRPAPLQSAPMRDLIRWAINTFASECPDVRTGKVQAWRQLYSYDFSDDLVECLDAGRDYFWTRIAFYLVWRAVLTNLYNIGAGVKDIGKAINEEMTRFCQDLETLAKMRQCPSIQAEIANIEWVYCSACIIPNTLLQEEESNLERRHTIIGGNEGDVFRVLEGKEKTFDLILTDPPYGFNTDYDDAVELGGLYINAFRQMMKALKQDGQLICCLPAESFNGQSLSYFSTRRMVVRDLLCAAEAQDREVRYPGGALPDPVALYKPPYYWRSEKALTRTVLHIRLSNKHAHSPSSLIG